MKILAFWQAAGHQPILCSRWWLQEWTNDIINIVIVATLQAGLHTLIVNPISEGRNVVLLLLLLCSCCVTLSLTALDSETVITGDFWSKSDGPPQYDCLFWETTDNCWEQPGTKFLCFTVLLLLVKAISLNVIFGLF